ncbi:L,D-transpeptidase family protein [Patescibacteria group bacterium]
MIKKLSLVSIIIIIAVFCFVSADTAWASEERAPEVRAFNTLSGMQEYNFDAYSPNYNGGASVAVGDISGDDNEEIITVSGLGGRTHVRGFSRTGRFIGLSFFPFHPEYSGGGDVAVGNVDGVGKDEIIVSVNGEGESRIKVYRANGDVIGDFLAFTPEFRGGAYVAAGDVNRDGKDEIIVGAGSGGKPHVRVFDSTGRYLGLDFFPYPDDYDGGVDVAAADVDADGTDEIIVGSAARSTARVKVYEPNAARTVISDFLAFLEDYQDGVQVGGADIDGDGSAEIIAAPSSNYLPEVKTFETNGRPARFNKVVYENDFRGGVDVAGGDLDNDGRADVVTAPRRFIWEGRRDLYKYIDINLSNNILTVYEGGRKQLEAITSTGRPGMATPTGEFSVRRKERNHWSGQYGLWMPYSLNFYGAYYMHRLPEWPGGYVEGENHLGMNVSHGCVRVGMDEAPILYDLADIGTPVIIHY